MGKNLTMKLGALLGALCSMPLAAQPRTDDVIPDAEHQVRVGLYGAYQITQHDADFAGIPTIPTCNPGYTSGSGSGTAYGATVRYRFMAPLSAQLRVGYSGSKDVLTAQEDIGNVMDDGSVVSAISEHRIDVEFGSLEIEPSALFHPFSFPLTIGVGMRIGSVIANDYFQKETLISPTGMAFYGGRTMRNDYGTDKIPDRSSTLMAVVGSLSYDLPVSRRLTLSPEINYGRSITEVVPDTAWKVHQLRFGAALTFRIGTLPPGSEPDPPTDPAPVTALATVQARGVGADNSEAAIAQIRVEEFLSSQLRPLLNYVFFDEGSAELPSRYTRVSPAQTASFNVERLYNMDVLPTYYHMLNIVGKRMREKPSAALTITGCNADVEAEKGRTDLSRQRAEGVRNYLRDVWGIAENRMKIEARNLPSQPSNQSDPDGVAENRRVEFRSDDPSLLAPVLTADTVRTSNPPTVRFRPTAPQGVQVARWRLVATQGGTPLKEFSGNGVLPPAIDWRLEREQGAMPRTSDPLEFRLEVTGADGKSYSAPAGQLRVDQVTIQQKRRERVADREINRYSLILFDFGKADISDANRRIVDFIKGRISDDATVAITGYTDRVGDAELNQRLSEERARATARALSLSGADVSGAGESVLLYDNDLPEGRFYCRTVNVVVETPVGE